METQKVSVILKISYNIKTHNQKVFERQHILYQLNNLILIKLTGSRITIEHARRKSLEKKNKPNN